MIAYNKEWLTNIVIREQLRSAFNQSNITAQEYSTAINLYPVGFYTPNIFIRAGLFVLTLIIIAFTFGLVLLPLMDAHFDSLLIFLCVLFSVSAYLVLEFMIKRKNHYRSGVDDALLWASGALLCAALYLMNSSLSIIGYLCILIVAFYFTCRFANFLMGAVTVVALLMLLSLLFHILFGYSWVFQTVILFAICCSIYFLSKNALEKNKYKLYTNALLVIQITGLVLAYKYVNYYFLIGKNGTGILNDAIPLPIFYRVIIWLLTIALPLVYIYYGIKNKDQLLSRVGGLLLVVMIYTIRQFYHLLPIEILLVFGGLILTPLAYFLSKFLQSPKYGFTSRNIFTNESMDKLQVESLLAAASFSGDLPQLPKDINKFGGGSFGGGGASGEF